MATLSSILSPNPLQHSTKPFTTQFQTQPTKLYLQTLKFKPTHFHNALKFSISHSLSNSNSKVLTRLFAVAEETAVLTQDPLSEAARRVYIGNIPRNVNNEELRRIVEEHGAVEKAEVMYDKYSGRSRRFAFVTMKTVEDANAAVEKLNGTQIGERDIKVNITEKPLTTTEFSILQAEESQFIDSPHKVYVGNLAKTVTSDSLKNFFAEKGKVLSAKVSRLPGTSKSTGFGFVSFSSEDDVEAAISSFNNSLFEGQKIRVNKA